MLCCGLGKQKPYVHSGKPGEGEAEVKNADVGFLASLGQREHSCKQGWTFSLLGAGEE